MAERRSVRVTRTPAAGTRGSVGWQGIVRSVSEPQGLGVLPGLQPQVGDAGVLAVALGGGGHHGRGGGRLRQRGDGQPEGRWREHQVGRVGRQVRVQVRVRVSHALQLQLRLDLGGGGRDTASAPRPVPTSPRPLPPTPTPTPPHGVSASSPPPPSAAAEPAPRPASTLLGSPAAERATCQRSPPHTGAGQTRNAAQLPSTLNQRHRDVLNPPHI